MARSEAATRELFVGVLVRKKGAALLVRQSAGHPLAGRWTVPWGHVEPNESPLEAALRETLEEAGVEARILGLLGVQELPAPQLGGVALVYLGEHVSGDPSPRDRETDAARYFSAAELAELEEPLEPWSRWLAMRVLRNEHTLVRNAASSPLSAHGAFL